MKLNNLLKNITSYRAELPEMDTVRKAFEAKPFENEGAVTPMNFGFVNNPHTGLLITPLPHNCGYSFTVRIDSRSVPASVLKEELKKRIKEIEQQQDYKVGRKQRKELKEDLHHTLLAKSFVITKLIDCIYHPSTKHLIVDTGSQKDADVVTTLMLRALGTIRCSTIYVDGISNGITARLRAWLDDDDLAFEGFDVGGMCKLERKVEDKETITFAMEDLRTDAVNIIDALDFNFACKEIALITKAGSVPFTLNSRLQVRKIVHGEEPRAEHHDDAQHWIHEASVRTITVTSIMDALCGMFGYKEPEYQEENEE